MPPLPLCFAKTALKIWSYYFKRILARHENWYFDTSRVLYNMLLSPHCYCQKKYISMILLSSEELLKKYVYPISIIQMIIARIVFYLSILRNIKISDPLSLWCFTHILHTSSPTIHEREILACTEMWPILMCMFIKHINLV